MDDVLRQWDNQSKLTRAAHYRDTEGSPMANNIKRSRKELRIHQRSGRLVTWDDAVMFFSRYDRAISELLQGHGVSKDQEILNGPHRGTEKGNPIFAGRTGRPPPEFRSPLVLLSIVGTAEGSIHQSDHQVEVHRSYLSFRSRSNHKVSCYVRMSIQQPARCLPWRPNTLDHIMRCTEYQHPVLSYDNSHLKVFWAVE
ncbi:hypothetical protein EV356DRAFT_106426 [Viridothelium virens]|uniref:Uncharacterized protein n=1 Tax=Viridothelium virens TaxID=1048519 RepID=A0A6A6HQD3_VIRVR|nr:hypothetical protein EV356DRAFT_106426 [Viridothelium virens]